MPDFTGLADLARTPDRATKEWQPLTIDDLGDGSVLAFDQSLTATGWVKVVKVDDRIKVLEAGKFQDIHTGMKRGVEQDYARGVDVFIQAYDLIQISFGFALAHESPPHGGNVKGGGKSSKESGLAIRIAAASLRQPIEMLGAQPGKKLVCGNANAPKPEAHAALKLHCFPWIEGSDLVTNEATRDALIVALLWLHRRK